MAAALLVCAGLVWSADSPKLPAPAAEPAPAAADHSPQHVDLAICLDTSNSMDGLINAARSKLWDIVNTLATAKPRPILRVALYEYGNDNLNRETGWIRKVLDLTDDLDTVYKELMALRTRGGTEYVARVVTAATEDLKWTPDKNALKIIYVAGNEPATQDPKIKHADAARTAINRGIMVNTIHCGDHVTGIQTGWQEVAKLADGQYASIDQNDTFAVATPYDARLVELGQKLNATYVPYGPRGAAGQANQVAQDANSAAVAPSSAAQRSIAKSSALYNNSGWDLVDASKSKDFKLDAVKEADLSDEMKKMTPEQRKAHVDEMARKRADIQAEITKLADQQREFIAAERAKNTGRAAKSLDHAMLKSLTEQAERKGFTFEKK